MCRAGRLLSFVVLLMIAVTSPAWAENRVALVIGNANYRNVPSLTNPASDAKLMANTLKTLGFKLVGDEAQIDLDKAGLDSAVRSFGSQLQGADVGLFYYAGHGLQVRGANYLVPVGANPVREADVDFELEDVALVLRQMEASGTRLNLVMLDACPQQSVRRTRLASDRFRPCTDAGAGRHAHFFCDPTGQRCAGRRQRQ
jgi:uncharacterized caspase-like protein